MAYAGTKAVVIQNGRGKNKRWIDQRSDQTGEFLPSETELVERFGVGKSSVREAIKMLEALGVVEICKGNGAAFGQQ